MSGPGSSLARIRHHSFQQPSVFVNRSEVAAKVLRTRGGGAAMVVLRELSAL